VVTELGNLRETEELLSDASGIVKYAQLFNGSVLYLTWKSEVQHRADRRKDG
jgi:hypothetical protein